MHEFVDISTSGAGIRSKDLEPHHLGHSQLVVLAVPIGHHLLVGGDGIPQDRVPENVIYECNAQFTLIFY